MAAARPDPLLARTMRACRSQFVVVGGFSLLVNLLQLTTSLYMLQVYDRVLASRSVETLLYLTLITVAALLLLALLDAARSSTLQRTAAWVEQTVLAGRVRARGGKPVAWYAVPDGSVA